jgi:hypothetical protein
MLPNPSMMMAKEKAPDVMARDHPNSVSNGLKKIPKY